MTSRHLTALLATLTLAGLAPTAAQAYGPTLTPGEACRVAGRVVYQEYDNVRHGSGPCYTQARPGHPDQRLVDKLYRDHAGACWQTTISIRETWAGNYRYRILSDHRTRWGRCY